MDQTGSDSHRPIENRPTLHEESRRILLVEDQAILALSQARILEDYGFEVITAYTGESAVAKVEQDPRISLILMDIDLGNGIDGTQAAERILLGRELPIVFLTSHAEKEYVDRVKAITRYGYVLKNSGEFVLTESISMAFELFEAHRGLKRSNDDWRTTFDAIGEIVMVISADHTILRTNRSGCNALGLASDEIVGRKCFELVHGTDRPIEACPCTRSLETGRTSVTEYAENGRLYELIAWPTRSDETGAVDSFVHMVSDITDRRRADE